MALVVLLKGVNVGGHRSFRPSLLAKQLKGLDAVNVGAAGTFVIRRPVTRAKLRAELIRQIPFEAEVMICSGREILRLASDDPFAAHRLPREVVRFVSVLAKPRRPSSLVPCDLPSGNEWCVRILAHDGRFVFGVYRREMRTIRYLGELERIFGVPATTRNWNSILAIVKVLENRRL
jgi:uncharacterized protein (DUF1697 family)